MAENEKDNEIKWEKQQRLGIAEQILPIANYLLLVIEEEKKRTMEKLEKAKKLLEIMKAG